MCGIIGIISGNVGQQYKQKSDFFTQGLFVDAVRGMDSTGFFLAGASGRQDTLFKKALNSLDFLDLETTRKHIRNIEFFPFVIGHNRKATRGYINSSNAHPFNHGNITLVHNGTLNSNMGLTQPKLFDLSVDSELVTYNLDQCDTNQEIISLLESISGSFVFIWYNSLTKTLNVVRNDERTLAYARVKNQDTIYLASEIDMLKWLCKRNNIEIENYYHVKPGYLLTHHLDKITLPESISLKLKTGAHYHYPAKSSTNDSNFFNQPSIANNHQSIPSLVDINLAIGDKIGLVYQSFQRYTPSAIQGNLLTKQKINGYVVNFKECSVLEKEGLEKLNNRYIVRITQGVFDTKINQFNVYIVTENVFEVQENIIKSIKELFIPLSEGEIARILEYLPEDSTIFTYKEQKDKSKKQDNHKEIHNKIITLKHKNKRVKKGTVNWQLKTGILLPFETVEIMLHQGCFICNKKLYAEDVFKYKPILVNDHGTTEERRFICEPCQDKRH